MNLNYLNFTVNNIYESMDLVSWFTFKENIHIKVNTLKVCLSLRLSHVSRQSASQLLKIKTTKSYNQNVNFTEDFWHFS